jgi:hypothetical protein
MAWLVAAGVVLGLAAWVRAAAAPMLPFLVLWALLAIPGPWLHRVGRAALAGGWMAAVLLVYFSLNAASSVGDFGLTRTTGWTLYARTATFADCTRFDPPPGTATLCDDTPPASRPNPDYYHWVDSSPAWRTFGGPPNGDDELFDFGWEALKSQPYRYANNVFDDTLRYFLPERQERPFSPGYDFIDVHSTDPIVEGDVHGWIRTYYPDAPRPTRSSAVETLSEVQDLLRAQPPLLALAAILGVAGCALAAARVRAGLALVTGTGLLLLILPAAILEYNVRFVIPATGPIIAGGAIGAWVVARRIAEWRTSALTSPSSTRQDGAA